MANTVKTTLDSTLRVLQQEGEKDINADTIRHEQMAFDNKDNAELAAVVREDAIQAENVELALTLHESLSIYRSAILWSAAISLVIIMDGYDTGRE
jgi:hypothetical protein